MEVTLTLVLLVAALVLAAADAFINRSLVAAALACFFASKLF